MRILHIMNYYQEGMGYQENWLPYFQKKLGHDVKILTSDKYFPFPNYDISMKSILGDRIINEGIFYDKEIEIIRKKSFFEIESKAIILFDTSKVLESFNPDVIHLHGITNLNLFQILKHSRKKNVKIFIDSHSDYQVSNHKSMLNKIYYKVWKFIYKIFNAKVNLFLPTTKEAKNFLNNEFDILSSKISINYLGVNIENFYYDEQEKNNLINKYNLQDKIVIINAGKQYKEKKIDFIIDIVNKLINEFNNKNVILFLIGNATKEYEKLILNDINSIKKNVIRLPFVKNSDLKAFYSLADIGIWPGIPSNTIQEAMACEVAMVLPQNDTINHLIDNNGFLIDEFNTHLISEKINSTLLTSKLEEYKKKSREIAEKYSWKKIAIECLEIYEKN